ncbi:MAG: PIN domain-containing protein [Patescibacteria group bacterium]|nr:PIN domain-containing protein [Patescibacteria group bacterium]
MATNPRSRPDNEECKKWLAELVLQGTRVILPEIADYEVRRELIRAGKLTGIGRLDHLKANVEYLPLTTTAMLLAADLWARVRNTGMQTASDLALDGDVILAAQALTCGVPSGEIVVATTNTNHLVRLVGAKLWRDIS